VDDLGIIRKKWAKLRERGSPEREPSRISKGTKDAV